LGYDQTSYYIRLMLLALKHQTLVGGDAHPEVFKPRRTRYPAACHPRVSG
jgi:hypothetical protein